MAINGYKRVFVQKINISINKLNSKGSLDMRFMDVVTAYLYVIPSGFLPCLPKAKFNRHRDVYSVKATIINSNNPVDYGTIDSVNSL